MSSLSDRKPVAPLDEVWKERFVIDGSWNFRYSASSGIFDVSRGAVAARYRRR